MKTKLNSLLPAAAALVAVTVFNSGCQLDKASSNVVTVAPGTAVASAPAIAAAPAVKPALKFISVDSAETAGETGAGANAVDGNPETFWHTQWQDATPECPHEIIIELVPATTIKGFTYLPRQDDNDHGFIKGYEFSTSDDGQTFSAPVAKGEFDGSKELKSVTFVPIACRFIKLKAVSEINGEAWTSVAEIGVVQ